MKVLKTRARTSENFLSWHRLGDRIGLTGVCVYFIGFVLPLTWDIPLILLGVCGSLALISKSNRPTRSWPPLSLPILIFIASIGLSTLFSEDIGRSLQLNTPLLPALLLFFLISQHFDGTRDTRLLFMTFSIVGLGVAVALLLTGWYDASEKVLREVVKNLGIPILVVPNDVAFLAIIAPLSLAVFFHHPRSVIGTVALLSALLSVGAVCVFRSRTAALTIFITMTCAIILMQPKQQWVRGAIYAFAFLMLALIIDGLLGSPLMAKIVRKGTTLGRMSYWSTAWNMFLEAPVLGKGPHTFILFHNTPWVHNLYLEVLAEQGLIGLAALVGLLVTGVKAVWRVYRNAAGEARLLSAGVLAAFIGFCSAAVFELSLLRQWVVIVLFTLLGMVAQLSSSHERIEG